MRIHFQRKALTLSLTSILWLGGPGLMKGIAGQKHKAELHTHRSPEDTQRWLEKEVHHELVMLPFYSVFDNLAYRVKGDSVELSGQVSRPVLKSDAERAVKNIEGVQTVVNHIEVLPTSPEDDRTRLALYRAIYGHTALQPYSLRSVPPIHIIVKNGHVTLEGVVANEMDKNIANIQANSVPGVFSVQNNLRVEG